MVSECGRSVRARVSLFARGGVEACGGDAVGVGVGAGVVVVDGVDGLGLVRVGVCSGRGR